MGKSRRSRRVGGIGTERREVEFEPLPEEPVQEPQQAPAELVELLQLRVRERDYLPQERVQLGVPV